MMQNDQLQQYLALMGMGAGRPEEQEEIKRQYGLADALRGQAMEGTKGRQVGRVFVAPSMAETLGSMATGAGSALMQKQADAKAREVGGRRDAQNKKLMELLMMQGGGQPQTPGQMPQQGGMTPGLNPMSPGFGQPQGLSLPQQPPQTPFGLM